VNKIRPKFDCCQTRFPCPVVQQIQTTIDTAAQRVAQYTHKYIYINNNFEYFEVVKYFTLSDHSIVLGNRNVMTDDRRTNRDELKLMTNDTSTV